MTVHTTILHVYRVQWQSTLPNCMSTEFSDSPHYQTACLQSSVTVHTTKRHVYRVQWQSTLPNGMSTEFSDSPHYQTACLQSSVTVHTTKLHVYRVQWQSTLPNVIKNRISGLELWQVGKDSEGNRLTNICSCSFACVRMLQTNPISIQWMQPAAH